MHLRICCYFFYITKIFIIIIGVYASEKVESNNIIIQNSTSTSCKMMIKILCPKKSKLCKKKSLKDNYTYTKS